MEVTISLGEGDQAITVDVSDDALFTPELCQDLLRRAADTALRLHGELHPATDGA